MNAKLGYLCALWLVALVLIVTDSQRRNQRLEECESFDDETCRSDEQFHANPNVESRRWQTPRPNSINYKPSYQHYHSLVGYTDIRYTSSARNQADVCIQATHRRINSSQLIYIFDGVKQRENCKRFSVSHKNQVRLGVTASDGSTLILQPVDLFWNVQRLATRASGDYRGGQKGAIVDFFGWKHMDVEKECQILSKAGYLGAKLLPVTEHIMSKDIDGGALNPWYYSFQPISYNFDSRFGTREDLVKLIQACRALGVRVYVDLVLNHFAASGNDCMSQHRRRVSGKCIEWGHKISSAPDTRQSPFFTHSFTFEHNQNTGQPPSNEFPAAAIGPSDFHCKRELNKWSDLFILNNGWLVGLSDLDTSRENVRERQAAYLVELMSMGVSGFRIDAAKHMSPEDLTAIIAKVQNRLVDLPDDFILWLEVLSGGEDKLLWNDPGWYGGQLDRLLLDVLKNPSDLNKIKFYDGSYPAYSNPYLKRERVVIANDDHDLQSPNFSRDMQGKGCVLVKGCDKDEHRAFEVKLFDSPYWTNDNNHDWPIRLVLSSFYHTYGVYGVPDGLSTLTSDSNQTSGAENWPYSTAYQADKCAYQGLSYTRVHRDLRIINAMRHWLHLEPIQSSDINLTHC